MNHREHADRITEDLADRLGMRVFACPAGRPLFMFTWTTITANGGNTMKQMSLEQELKTMHIPDAELSWDVLRMGPRQ